MAKRYYYDCPIQALYMMKAFGIQLECDYDSEDEGYDETDGKSYPFEHSMISQPEMIEEVISELEELRKIYVKKESESIFEPKEGDFGKLANGFLISSFYQGRWRVFPDLRSNDSIDKSEIIMRKNKLFFMPEQEDNDQ